MKKVLVAECTMDTKLNTILISDNFHNSLEGTPPHPIYTHAKSHASTTIIPQKKEITLLWLDNKCSLQ